MKIITRYIFKESLNTFLMSFFVFSILFLFGNIYKIISKFTGTVETSKLIKLMLFFIPASFQLTIPICLLISTLMCLGRLASDSEIIAMRASGVSTSIIITPFIILASIMMIFSFYSANYLSPDFLYRARRLSQDIIAKKSTLTIKAGQTLTIKGKKITVGKIDGFRMYDIIMIDDNKDMITAKSGEFHRDGDTITLILNNGSIDKTVDKNFVNYDKTTFGKITKSFYIESGIEKKLFEKRDEELSFFALARKLSTEKKQSTYFEFHSKIALPAACLIFLFISLPIGMTAGKTGKAIGFTWGLLSIFIYYILFAAAKTASLKTNDFDMIKYIIWLPNAATVLTGSLLFKFYTLKKI